MAHLSISVCLEHGLGEAEAVAAADVIATRARREHAVETRHAHVDTISEHDIGFRPLSCTRGADSEALTRSDAPRGV